MSDSESGTPGAQSPLSRRSVLKGLAGAAGLAVVPGALLEACSSNKKTATTPTSAAPAATTSAAGAPSSAGAAPSSAAGAPSSAAGGGAATGTVTFGSNYSDAVPKAAFAAMIDGFTAPTRPRRSRSTPSTTTRSRRTSTPTCRARPTTCSPGSPATACGSSPRRAWPATSTTCGTRSAPTSPTRSSRRRTGDDGKQYFVPLYNYPWAIFYRKSVFAEKGYTIPTTWDELIALAKQMKTDGLVPIAFGERTAWPAMGTFDILNMRINGYEFHVDLMAHKETWDDPKVKAVFDQWAELLPYHQAGANGRTWQEAAQTLLNKQGRHVCSSARSSASSSPGRPRRPRLLPVPGDRRHQRHRLDRRTDRRLHDGSKPEERGRRQGAPRVPRHGARPRRSVLARPTRATSAAATQRRHDRTTTRFRRSRPS